MELLHAIESAKKELSENILWSVISHTEVPLTCVAQYAGIEEHRVIRFTTRFTLGYTTLNAVVIR